MQTNGMLAGDIDRDFVGEWSGRFLDAWNRLDREAVASLCSHDITWSDPSVPAVLTGRDGVRGFVDTMGRAFPDLRIEETDPPCVVRATARVLAPYRMTGTMLGELENFAATGRKLVVAGVDEWTFNDGLLCKYATYYDALDAVRQLGIMPARGSRMERGMAVVQHLQVRLQRRGARAA